MNLEPQADAIPHIRADQQHINVSSEDDTVCTIFKIFSLLVPFRQSRFCGLETSLLSRLGSSPIHRQSISVVNRTCLSETAPLAQGNQRM